MWILPKQLHTSAYAQDTKALGLDSEEFSQICEKSLTWRGKDSQSRTWLQRWKRENWMRHLCLRTLRPSLTQSFVDAWTSSLEDSRVSHSQLQESVKLLKTQDTSSLTSQTESESANLELFSLKTYKESSVARQPTESQFSNMSSESWKEWVIEQRQEYSQRKKSAHLIRESESSSSELDMNWATPIANDAKGSDYAGMKENPKALYLGGQVKNWSTPTVMDTANIQEPRKKNPSGGQKPPLCQEVKNWATPNTMDYMEQRSPEALQRQFKTTRKGRTAPANLREQVHPQNWPTASTRDHKGGYTGGRIRNGKVSMDTLDVAVQALTEGGLLDQANPNTNGRSQESWPTPRANKVHPEITEENREHLANRNKANLEENIAGHCGKATGKLNPNWVEHLMGLPAGWTQLPTAWTDSGC